jgi:hypothetical protein
MLSTAVVLSLHVMLVAAGPGQRAAPDPTADLVIDVMPAILLQNQDMRAVVRVRPSTVNRTLTVALDAGEFYSSTERSLDGERAARTYEFYFHKLPAGEYVLRVQVEDIEGRIRKTERHISVLGQEQAVEQSRRRR